MKQFELGTSVNINLETRHPDTQALADPATVICKVETPAGTLTTYTLGTSPQLTKLATGRFRCIVPVPTAGRWNFRWETTVPTLSKEGNFAVTPSDV